jgi:hypothetical protein
MKISLNKNDLHAAVRGYLASRNIVSDVTELEISIKAVKGGQPSAEVSIIDSNGLAHVTESDTETPTKESPFGDRLKGA